MQERTFVTNRGTFTLAPWDGTNRSGLKPLSDCVLVLVDAAAEKSAGGIEFTDNTKEASTLGSCTGVLVMSGPQAFVYDSNRALKWEGDRPQPGERIWFQRYAGQEHYGLDGKLYRLMSDRSVAGMEDKEAIEAAEAEHLQTVRIVRRAGKVS